MKRVLIVSGGNVNRDIIKELMKDNDFTHVIAVDKGLEALDEQKIMPDHIIGDFDSVNEKILDKYKQEEIIIHKLDTEKDYTDTHMGLKLAIELGANEILITGATGSRIDHTIANIHLLEETLQENILCKIIDNNSELIVIDRDTKIKKDDKYKYISLIPLTNEVTGITLRGFKYKLENSTLRIGQSIGISNEQIEDIAHIEIQKGKLIVVKARD